MYYKVTNGRYITDERIISATSPELAANVFANGDRDRKKPGCFVKVVQEGEQEYTLFYVITNSSGIWELVNVEEVLGLIDNDSYPVEQYLENKKRIQFPETFGCDPEGEHVGGGHLHVKLPWWKRWYYYFFVDKDPTKEKEEDNE